MNTTKTNTLLNVCTSPSARAAPRTPHGEPMVNRIFSRRLLSLGAIGAVALALFAALPAWAGLTGSLDGYVVDTDGTPVAEARVILTSPQMIGGEKVVLTDAEGQFRFAELEPGSYTVVISHATYRGFKEEGIVVGVNATVIRDYLLEPASAIEDGSADVVRVVASAPMVDTTRTSMGRAIRPDFTDRTVTSRDYQGVANFVAGVVGGSTAPGNPAIHGGTPYSNLYLLDGLNITDPVTQTFSANFNFDSIGELQVITGGMDAEYGSTLGGVLNIVTKSGGDEFELDGSVYWSPKELNLLDPGETNNSSDVGINLAVGGPIIRKKLWFFVSGQYVDTSTQNLFAPGATPIFPDVKELPLRRFNGFYGLGKLKWAVTPWEKVTVQLQGDPTWIVNDLQDVTIHPDAEEQRFQGGARIIATSETTLSESIFWKTSLGYANNSLNIFPASNDLTTAGHTNQATGTTTVNDTQIYDDNRTRVQLQSHLSYFLENFGGDHEFKVGLEGTLAWFDVTQDVPGSAIYSDNGIDGPGSSISGIGDPFQVTLYEKGGLRKLVSSNLVSAFVQDTWRPFRSLTVRPGLRFDSSRSYNDPEDGGQEIFNFNTLSPRLGLAWDPFGDGKTVLRGGGYVYRETGLLTVPNFVGRDQKSTTYQYNPATEKYDILVSSQGGEQAVQFKPGMSAPLMYELMFGFQRQLGDDTAVAVDFLYRRRQNMFEDDESNVLWNAAGDAAVGFRNGEPRFIYSVGTPDNAMGQYVGMDVAFEKRLSDKWSADVTYTLSRLEGTVEDLISVSFDRPRQAPYEYGFLADDVRHRLRATLTYDLPYGLQIGGTAIYNSGRPFSKGFLNNFYGDYTDRRASRGYDPKNLDDKTDDVELRLPDQLTINTRIAWRLKELTTQDIWLIADISNVLNSRPTTAIEARDLPPGSPTQFGQPTDRGGPMSGTLALRYLF